MLEADRIHSMLVQKAGGALVVEQVGLANFVTHLITVGIPFVGVIHGKDHALHIGELLREGIRQVGGKGCNATLARQMIANERDPIQVGY
jgi:hypothetical protein